MSSDFVESIKDFLPTSRILHHEGWIPHLRCGPPLCFVTHIARKINLHYYAGGGVQIVGQMEPEYGAQNMMMWRV